MNNITFYRIQGVESLSVGFSKKREGYWPVIRVSLDKKTCSSFNEGNSKIEKAITNKLKAILNEHFGITWTEEELQDTIEVVTNYPLKTVELCSAGEEISTWTFPPVSAGQEQPIHKRGTVTCNVHHQLQVGQETYETHYMVTAFHVTIPANSEYFQSLLPQLPEVYNKPENSVIYKHFVNNPSEVSHNPSELLEANGSKNELHLVPTLLRASFFPKDANIAFTEMKSHLGFRSQLISTNGMLPEQSVCEAEFLFGKAGLIGNSTTDHTQYLHVLVENPEENQQLPFHKHPCNIDIAVLKHNNKEYVCNFEELFSSVEAGEGIVLPSKIKWFGPPEPDIEHWKGILVFIKKGKVQKLSGKLDKLEPKKSDGISYPCCVWTPEEGVTVAPGDSGSPVFLMIDDSFYFIGGLITGHNASPFYFTHDRTLIEHELAIHHMQLVAQKMEEEKLKLKQQGHPTEAIENNLTCLRRYMMYVQRQKDEQHLLPPPSLKFSDLKVPGDGIIESKMNVCLNTH